MTRILIVDHHAIHSAGRALYRELAATGGYVLRVIAPRVWKEYGITYSFEPFASSPVGRMDPRSISPSAITDPRSTSLPAGKRLHPNQSVAARQIRTAPESLTVLPSPVLFGGKTHRNLYYRLSREVRTFRPDILLVNSEPEGFLALQAVALCRFYRLDAAVVFTTWRNMNYGEPGEPFPVQWPWLSRMIERYVLPRSAHGIAHSPSATRIFASKGFGEISYVPPWVDLERFAGATPRDRMADASLSSDGDYSPDNVADNDRSSRSGPEHGPGYVASQQAAMSAGGMLRVGFVGRLVPEKGVDILVKALRDIDCPIHLTIVGDGPEKSTLKRLVQASGLSDRCTFLPSVPSGRIPEIMRAFDVLVLPSCKRPGWREQFGRVLIEAMASGVVAVGSDSGDIPQVIGDAGFIFGEGDSIGLRSILRRLASDPALRKTSCDAGLRRVTEEYSLVAAVRRYAQLFDSLKFKRENRTIEKTHLPQTPA